MKGGRSKKYTVNSKSKVNERVARRAYAQERNASSYLSEDQHIGSWKIQLDKLGLEIREIPADGNCLFRALADQLDGTSNNHLRYRSQVCIYMTEHQDEFEPFLDEGMSFDKYISLLRKSGTFAGNDALVAFANLFNVVIVIHQLNMPAFRIEANDTSSKQRELHLSYHNGEHYSSIRTRGDKSSSPAQIKSTAKKQTKNTMEDDSGSLGSTPEGSTCGSASNDVQDDNYFKQSYEEHEIDGIADDFNALALKESVKLSSEVSINSIVSSNGSSNGTSDSGVWSEASSSLSNTTEESLTETKKRLTKSERKQEKKKRAELRHKKLTSNRISDTNNNDSLEKTYEIPCQMELLSV